MMEVEKMSTRDIANSTTKKQDDDNHDEGDVPLPGFRFHPTDEELVGFYLRRKVEKRAISIQLIKQIDIYKYDPWDLPKGSNVGDKEWYFFCKRGRKYRNSIRPNRVTGSGSGFWKATGIDRPIHSTGGQGQGQVAQVQGRDCIGLKKSLVYYRGCAGKGTKTDWMMHEFRLPPDDHHKSTTPQSDTNNISQEAEVWTLCRIFKRNVSYRKCIPDLRELSSKPNVPVDHSSSKTCTYTNMESSSENREGYISFRAPFNRQSENKPKPVVINHVNYEANYQLSSISQALPLKTTTSYSNFLSRNVNEILEYGDWDDLRSVVEHSVDDPLFL